MSITFYKDEETSYTKKAVNKIMAYDLSGERFDGHETDLNNVVIGTLYIIQHFFGDSCTYLSSKII